MAEIAFQYQVPQKMIGTFVVDAFIAEHYSFSNSVTDIPVEEGSNIADHIVEEQDVISVEAFIGNTAFEVITSDGNAVSNLQAPDRTGRIRLAYQELKKLTKEKKLYDVVLGLETFTDMAVTAFNLDREAETGANLPFSMEFRKLKIVKSNTTQINTSGADSSSSSSASDQTAKTDEYGTEATENLTESQMKEVWRQKVLEGIASPADYQRKWGVPYPQ